MRGRFFLLLVAITVPVAVAQPPAGPWEITSDVTLTGQDIIVRGDVYVRSGATLTLEESTLRLEVPHPYEPRFLVEAGAELVLIGSEDAPSVITDNPGDADDNSVLDFDIWMQIDGLLEGRHCDLQELGVHSQYAQLPLPAGTPIPEFGFVNTGTISLTDCSISRSKQGLQSTGGTVTLDRVTANGGIRLTDTVANVRNSTITGGFGGLNGPIVVVNTTISGGPQNGFSGNDTVHLEGVRFRDATFTCLATNARLVYAANVSVSGCSRSIVVLEPGVLVIEHSSATDGRVFGDGGAFEVTGTMHLLNSTFSVGGGLAFYVTEPGYVAIRNSSAPYAGSNGSPGPGSMDVDIALLARGPPGQAITITRGEDSWSGEFDDSGEAFFWLTWGTWDGEFLFKSNVFEVESGGVTQKVQTETYAVVEFSQQASKVSPSPSLIGLGLAFLVFLAARRRFKG